MELFRRLYSCTYCTRAVLLCRLCLTKLTDVSTTCAEPLSIEHQLHFTGLEGCSSVESCALCKPVHSKRRY